MSKSPHSLVTPCSLFLCAPFSARFVVPFILLATFETIQNFWYVVIDLKEGTFLETDIPLIFFNLLALFLVLLPMSSLTANATQNAYELETNMCFQRDPRTIRLIIWLKHTEIGWKLGSTPITNSFLARFAYVAMALLLAALSYFAGV